MLYERHDILSWKEINARKRALTQGIFNSATEFVVLLCNYSRGDIYWLESLTCCEEKGKLNVKWKNFLERKQSLILWLLIFIENRNRFNISYIKIVNFCWNQIQNVTIKPCHIIVPVLIYYFYQDLSFYFFFLSFLYVFFYRLENCSCLMELSTTIVICFQI